MLIWSLPLLVTAVDCRSKRIVFEVGLKSKYYIYIHTSMTDNTRQSKNEAEDEELNVLLDSKCNYHILF